MQHSGKTCVVCGIDCTGRPRVKDPKGRYYCQSCYDQARQQRSAQSGSASSSAAYSAGEAPPDLAVLDSMLDDLIAVEPTASPALQPQGCPSCGGNLAAGATFCINCGYNLQTNQSVQTRKIKASKGAGSMTVWPIVIGILALGWGGLNVGGSIFDMSIESGNSSIDTGRASGRTVGTILGIALNLLLIFGAVLLMMRRSRGVTLLRTWSGITVVFSIFAITCLGIVLGFAGTASEEFGSALGAESAGEARIFVVAALVVAFVNLGIATFLLAWFKRPKVQDDIGRWE